jgi:galactokinase
MTAASFARCRHIITENDRVMKARAALLQSDVVQFGQLMVQAHVSMRDDFAASCAEIDMLVEIAVRHDGCFGARITGGGFGGCTVNLVSAEKAESFVEIVRLEYEERTGIVAQCFICEPSNGALAIAAKGGVR